MASQHPDRREEANPLPAPPHRPGAVVVLTIPRGTTRHLPRALDALRDQRGPASLALAPGSLTILLLSPEPDAVIPVLHARTPGFPHPLRLHATDGTPDDHACARLAARLARSLGAPEAPVFLLDVRRPPAPGWLYAAAAALRDGEALVVGARRTLSTLPGFGPRPPRAVSAAGRHLLRPRRPSQPWRAAVPAPAR